MKKVISVVFIVSFLILTAACSDNSPFNFLKIGKKKTSSTPVVTVQPAVVTPARPIKGPLLAQVNDWQIGLDDFKDRLKNLQDAGMELTVEKAVILEELIKLVLLSQEAERRGYAKNPEVSEALEDYRRTILFQKLSEELTKGVMVSEQEISDFYNQAKDFYFKEEDQYKISEIAVSSETVANDLYMKAAFQGEDFANLARQNSLLPSRAQGGDIGYVSPASEEPKKFKRYWDVVSALDKGKVSFVFQGEDARFYILKLEDKKLGRTVPLSEVKEQIREALLADRQKKRIDELVEKLKADAKIVERKELLK